MSKKNKRMKNSEFDDFLNSIGVAAQPVEIKKSEPITEEKLIKKIQNEEKPVEKKPKPIISEKQTTSKTKETPKEGKEVVRVSKNVEDKPKEVIVKKEAAEVEEKPQTEEIVATPVKEIKEANIPNEKAKEKNNSKKENIESLFKKELSKEELTEYGKTRLKEIVYDVSQEEVLFPLVCQNLYGYKGVFIGDKGGLKEEFIDNLAILLNEIGKISSPKAERIPFSELPEYFEDDKLYIINDLNDAIIHLFNLDDLSQTSSVAQQAYRTKLNYLLKSSGSAYIILNSIKTDLKGFLTLDAKLPFLFNRKVEFQNLSNEAITERFVAALPPYHRDLITSDYKNTVIEFLNRNRRYFPFDNQELAVYLANYTSRFEDLRLPKEKYNAKTLEESFKSIVGMDVVKKQILELSEYLLIRQKLEKAGLKLPPFNLHMMFLGNPGVGKTTIARIIAKVLFDLGYIREEKLVEVTSKDLVSAYGNQTGIKTNKVIMSAMGGVLFVDEAYSLAISCGQAGAEAIANLIKAMEDYKGDLVVMFAGYSLEMQEFVRSNSGIASRISYVFEFTDYTDEELFQIFEIKLKNTGMIFGESAKEPVRKLCKFAAGRRNFGNGRFIDKLLQRALTKHATLNLPDSEIKTLIKDSIPEVEEIMASFGRFSG